MTAGGHIFLFFDLLAAPAAAFHAVMLGLDLHGTASAGAPAVSAREASPLFRGLVRRLGLRAGAAVQVCVEAGCSAVLPYLALHAAPAAVRLSYPELLAAVSVALGAAHACGWVSNLRSAAGRAAGQGTHQ